MYLKYYFRRRGFEEKVSKKNLTKKAVTMSLLFWSLVSRHFATLKLRQDYTVTTTLPIAWPLSNLLWACPISVISKLVSSKIGFKAPLSTIAASSLSI